MPSIDMETVRVAKSCSKIPKRKQAEEERREGYEQIFDKESFQLWNELVVQLQRERGWMLSLGARKQERLILIFQKTLLPQQKKTDTVGNSTFFTLIVTKNVHNVLMKVATGSKTKKNL